MGRGAAAEMRPPRDRELRPVRRLDGGLHPDLASQRLVRQRHARIAGGFVEIERDRGMTARREVQHWLLDAMAESPEAERAHGVAGALRLTERAARSLAAGLRIGE